MARLCEPFTDVGAGFREEAERARRLAAATTGLLRGELHRIAALYERLADGKDPEIHPARRVASRTTSPTTKRLARFSDAWPDAETGSPHEGSSV
jgi:hypothetical protein